MSLLPSFYQTEMKEKLSGEISVLEIPKEYGVDFETGQMTGGIVTEKEAVKVWIWNMLHTERFRYPIFSWNYGVELEQYIGQGFTQEYLMFDLETMLQEAFEENPYISGIEQFEVSFKKDRLQVELTVQTVFGEVNVRV